MQNLYKIGTVLIAGRQETIWVKVEIQDGALSFTGVEGPHANGNAAGSCGQIIGNYREHDARGSRTLDDINPIPPWTAASIRSLFAFWKRWHLSDMRAGCEHQRAGGWDKAPIDPSKPLTAYGKHFPGQLHSSWNMAGWVRPDEWEGGLLTKACSICGYKYGSAWLKETVPGDVLAALGAFPCADSTPAWI